MGNIGPVADMLLDELGARRAVVVRSYPANSRTVYNGYLFADGRLLAESSMKDHPLTPMRDSCVARLLASQTQRHVSAIALPIVRKGPRALAAALANRDGLVVLDAVDEDDLETIATATEGDELLTGDSALAAHLSGQRPGEARTQVHAAQGLRVVLVGSRSEATRRQVSLAAQRLPHIKLDVEQLHSDFVRAIDEIVARAQHAWAQDGAVPFMVYSADMDGGPAGDFVDDGAPVASLIEQTLGAIAQRFFRLGARNVVIGGGCPYVFVSVLECPAA